MLKEHRQQHKEHLYLNASAIKAVGDVAVKLQVHSPL